MSRGAAAEKALLRRSASESAATAERPAAPTIESRARDRPNAPSAPSITADCSTALFCFSRATIRQAPTRCAQHEISQDTQKYNVCNHTTARERRARPDARARREPRRRARGASARPRDRMPRLSEIAIALARENPTPSDLSTHNIRLLLTDNWTQDSDVRAAHAAPASEGQRGACLPGRD